MNVPYHKVYKRQASMSIVDNVLNYHDFLNKSSTLLTMCAAPQG